MMTMRTSLLLLAASLAPLYAQQAAEPAAPAAAVATAPTLAQQRAAVFSALAPLPRNISGFYALTNIGDNMLRLAQSGVVDDMPAEDLSEELLALDGVAIASTKASPATYAFISSLFECIRTQEAASTFAIAWSLNAREELADSISQTFYQTAFDNALKKMEAAGQPIHFPPTYICITSKPGQENILQALSMPFMMLTQGMGSEPGITLVQNKNGFSGIRINIREVLEARQEYEEDTEDEANAALYAELSKHTLCLLMRQEGNKLIIATCESPEELQLATSPEESALNTPMMAEYDARLGDGMLMAGHFSKEFCELSQAISNNYIFNLADGAAAVFHKLAAGDEAGKAAYEKAAAATNCLSQALKSLMRPVERPTSMLAWSDGDLHFLMKSDAMGNSYQRGTFRLFSLADAPQNIFYAESTPASWSGTLPSVEQLADAALSIAEGLSLTLNDENKPQTLEGLATVKTLMPELQAASAAGVTLAEGLDGQCAVIVDSVHAPLPACAGAPEGTEADIPRVSIYAGVKNREALTQGWKAVVAASTQAISKLGGDPNAANELPLESSVTGNSTSYCLALPGTSPDAVPSFALSDTGLAFGSSTALNQLVLESATGEEAGAGCIFNLNMEPLARSVRSLATAMAPAEEPNEPEEPADEQAAPEEPAVAEADGAEAAEGAEDVDEECSTEEICQLEEDEDDCPELPEPSQGAELEELATTLEELSTVVDCIFGTAEISEGEQKLHIIVELK